MTAVVHSAKPSNKFDFSSYNKYRAEHDLRRTRSANFSVPLREVPWDIRSRKPPDFRPQNYLPKPPKRNSRESMRPWRYSSSESQTRVIQRTQSEVALPKVLQPDRPRSRKMVLNFDIFSAGDARKESVRSSVHPKAVYTNPQPHDHRQHPPIQQLGLPEFVACMSPDPLNIKFKTKNLDIHHGVPQPRKDEYMGDQMGHPRGPQPKYEPDLILLRPKWPNIPQEYTRHRPRNRTPHTALMDTIEGRLTEQWAAEETGRHLREQRKRENHIRGILRAVNERKRRGERVMSSGTASSSR